jgi:membrane-bound metal-dependent hydrolase YbcI (DUF457 family)
MFIGHFAVGFASKRVAPRASLAVLLAAPLFLDILWPVFIAVGLEHVRIVPGITKVTPLDLYDMPWSHSLVMSLLWSVLFGGAYFALRRDRTASLVLGAGVFSHFILDWVTHRPDMQLWPGSPRYGLGLWFSLPGTLIVEGAMFVGALAIYVRTAKARNRKGSIGLWAFVAFLLIAYFGSIFGPPPPSTNALVGSAIVAWLLLIWAWWFDRNRDVSAASAG